MSSVAPTALVTFSVLHAYREMSSVIPELKRAGWRVAALVGFCGTEANALVDRLSAEGVEAQSVPIRWAYGTRTCSSLGTPPVAAQPRPARGRLPSFARPIVNTGHYILKGIAQRKDARAMLDKIAPDAIISNNFHSCCEFDNALNREAALGGAVRTCILTSPLVSSGHAKRARLINFQLGMLGASYRTDATWLSNVVARLKPGWTVGEGSEQILCWPPEKILAGRICGLAPRDVWQNPAGDFDRIYVPSQSSAAMLLGSGAPPEQVLVAGAPRLDAVTSLVRSGEIDAVLQEKLGLGPDEPYILYNVEPSWEHHYCDRDVHFGRIDRMAAFLRTLPMRTIVSLHPLCKLGDYIGPLEIDGKITISRELGIEYLYPRCRLVLSFGCSTNSYSSIWDKPIVMYDWFGITANAYRRELYSQPRLVAAETFEEMVRRIEEELEAGRPAQHRQQASREEAAPRIVADIEALVAAKKAAAA